LAAAAWGQRGRGGCSGSAAAARPRHPPDDWQWRFGSSSCGVFIGGLVLILCFWQGYQRRDDEFFYPWGRESVQIPEGRAYVKLLYQIYDLLKINKSAHLSTCRQISNLSIFPTKKKIDRSADKQTADFIGAFPKT
jgi:hypothetical protein